MQMIFNFFKSSVFALAYSFCSACFAFLPDNWAIRAREHFEWHNVALDGRNETYVGTSNTFNIWYEKPFNYSLGFAVGPLLGSARKSDSKLNPEFGSKIHLRTLGLEFKYFPLSSVKFFTRLGLSAQQLVTNGTLGNLQGWGTYAGLGWEIPVGWVSIAPEFAVRQWQLSNSVKGLSTTPSVGLHFYKSLR